MRVRGARRGGCDVSQLARIDAILTFELSAEGEVGKPMSMAATAAELPFFICVWALIRGKPFLCLLDETRANLKDATVHQDPKRWAFGRRYEASPSSVCVMRLLPTLRMQPYTRILNAGLVGVVQKRIPFFFVCVTRPVPTVGMQTVHQDPKRWACGRRSTASPSSVSTVRLTSTGRVLVGPCCIIYQREQAT